MYRVLEVYHEALMHNTMNRIFFQEETMTLVKLRKINEYLGRVRRGAPGRPARQHLEIAYDDLLI